MFLNDLISHPFILSFATYNSICTSSFCVFDFMLTRFNSAWGSPKDWQGSALRLCHGIADELPRDCPGIALRLPRDCFQDLQRNCLWPMDCLLIALGCKGVAEGLPRDILGIVSRLPSENCQGIAKGCRGPIYEKTMASENVGFGFFCLLGLLETNGSMF